MLEEDGEGMTTDLQFYRRTCGTKRSLRSANADRSVASSMDEYGISRV